MEPSRAYSSWPVGLRRVLYCLVGASVICLLQDWWLLVRTRNLAAFALAYAALSTTTYLIGTVFGLLGRRRTFFFCGLAIAFVQLMFVARYTVLLALASIEAGTFRWSRTALWNAGLALLAGTLAYYLLAKERPRLFGKHRN